jgi:endonuclease III-like uncharacterized protein
MDKIQKRYEDLLRNYGSQQWWPINGKYSGGPRNESERFEVCIGAILAQYYGFNYVLRGFNI